MKGIGIHSVPRWCGENLQKSGLKFNVRS